MRHAKSDWSGQGLADFDRTINLRGQKNAKQIGQWMVKNNFLPHKIISSSAIRARQTTELLVQQLDHLTLEDVQFDKDLYLASMDVLMECVQLYRNDTKSIMLVAHNPGIELLVNHLVDTETQMLSITTANLAIIEFTDGSFDIEKDKGSLIALIRPKELG
ncbi:MAG: phosphohistidine phosphatase [marine bacterium B5-7]|nr:MAG: phosphohistidine phosphatase [marine bacterium B5-7]